MRYAIGYAALVASALTGMTNGQEKKAEAILVKVDAGDLAREFEKDAKEARKKYDPNPPKGGAGGTIVEITGLVASVNARTKTVQFQTGTKVSVVLQAKKITGPDQKAKQMAVQASGRFKRFERNTVVIDCDEAMLLRVIEKK